LLTCCACRPATGQVATEASPERGAGMITVKPKETDELLANPHMGWQTFHRTRAADRNLPPWIPSTVHYARWGWGRLEPKDGEIDHAFLDGVLAETRRSGQKLAFRVMCCSTRLGRPYHPAWLKKIGGRELACDHGGAGPFRVPDLDDKIVLEKHLSLIRRLGQRYDGHADLDHVDLGSVGWWGEWHMSSSKTGRMPTPATRKKIVDAYLAAFRKTPLLMLIGGGEQLTYAAKRGAGWRADCLGDMGGFSKTWCHMRNGYPKWIRQGSVHDAWKTAPVAWETCWDMRKWVKEGWPLRFIFNYALACHGSYLNNKSAPLPKGKEVRPEIERFLRRLGYRLVLRELKHPASAAAGGPLRIEMKWQNVGSAPCYRPYRLAYRFTDARGRSRVVVGKVTVNKWLPGSVKLFTKEFFAGSWDLPPGKVVRVSETISLPGDLPAGEHRLAVAVVGADSTKPVIRLGIRGRARDGWYPLSTIRLGK
jgi:hypothetical protein